MVAEKSGKFPQTEAWVRGLWKHLEAVTREQWTLARLADEAKVSYGLLRRWNTGRNEPKAGNQRKLSAFANRYGYERELPHQPIDRANGVAESADMLNDQEAALVAYFRDMSPDDKHEVYGIAKQKAGARRARLNQLPAALKPKA